MPLTTPLDIIVAAALAARRFGLARTLLVGLLLSPVYIMTLPPVSCGCIRPIFRRCQAGAAYFAAMKSDLKNLASLQEIHFAEHGTFAYRPEELDFTSSRPVTVTIFASSDAWAAVATHARMGPERPCTVQVGVATDVAPSLVGYGESGAVVCATQ